MDGTVPKVSNSDPEYLLYQLKVFIAKSGAVLDRAWRVTVAMRTQGASAGSYDATYWAPDNKRYRSRLEVARAVGVAPWVPPKKPKGETAETSRPERPEKRSVPVPADLAVVLASTSDARSTPTQSSNSKRRLHLQPNAFCVNSSATVPPSDG